jgi:hypothetical protein
LIIGSDLLVSARRGDVPLLFSPMRSVGAGEWSGSAVMD